MTEVNKATKLPPNAFCSAPLQAEKRMLEKGENKEYLPIEGLAAFREATLNLLLGDKNPAVKEVRPALCFFVASSGRMPLPM